jgi:hypothetical protein
MEIELTKFQAEEIVGLLSIIADQNDIATSDEDRMIVWGEMSGTRSKRSLIVLDADAAIVDLDYRSEYMIEEGDQSGPSILTGYSGARSLRLVIGKIEAASL